MPIKDYNFVFDLDDTLYKERDYVHSALRFCGNMVHQLYAQSDPSNALIAAFEQEQPDPIGTFWAAHGLPEVAKSGLISAMHAHIPDISLDQTTAKFITDLRAKGAGFAILTDGRSLTQRAKIAALGLLDADIICISEEIGAQKPSETGFKAIEAHSQGRQNIYIGDNPQKDFVAPNALGWQTVMLRDSGQNIRRPADKSATQAQHSIAHIGGILDILKI